MGKTAKLAGTKAHTRYVVEVDGEKRQVPGVTTVTRLHGGSKEVLIKWANQQGLEGNDVAKVKDKAADIGTCAHYLVECYLKQVEPDLSLYSPDTVGMAENACLSYFEWEKNHDVEVLLTEGQLVHDRLFFGGTIDLYAMVDGVLSLVDFKTGSGIYPEHLYQVAAYKELLEHNGNPVEAVRILRIGRDENEGFEDKLIPNAELALRWRGFTALLDLYNVEKEIRQGKAALKKGAK